MTKEACNALPNKEEKMIKESDVLAYLESKAKPQYSRTQFDAFLNEVNFKFNRAAIHITGTNGKGSVAYFLNETLMNGGYKVGRFVSPSLKTPNEMITINNSEINNADFLKYIQRYDELFVKYELTYFEIISFIALTYFKEKRVDIAIIEVGMGGTIDATNIFTPILSIITNVTLEHTDFLGKTIEEIATHKAGIIKPKVPVLLGPMNEAAFTTIANVAITKQAFLYGVKTPINIRVSLEGICFDALHYKNICLSMPASYEATNAALALSALEIISTKFPVERDLVFSSFKGVKVPARFSIIQAKPLVIVDGAHNPAAMSALINSVKLLSKGAIKVVFAAFKDKDVKQEFDLLALANASVVVTTFDHHRARKEEHYPNLTYPFVSDYHQAIKETIGQAKEDEVILITGSLHFALQVYNEFTKEE